MYKKNYKTLTKELDLLTNQTEKNINIHTSSILSILQYKLRLQKKKKLEIKLLKLNNKKNEFVTKFDTKIEKILNDPKVLCRRYCKMEQSLTYKKEKLLYKFGYTSKKPISPIKKEILSKLSPITKFSKSIISMTPFYKSNPQKNITNFAISTTKKYIKGCQKVENIKNSAQSAILQSALVKKLSYIKDEALRQLEEEKSSQENDSSTEFLKRIKLDPNIILETPNIPTHSKTRKPITHTR